MSALPIVVAKALLLHTLLLSMHTATIVALAVAIPETLANTTDTIFLDTLANLTITTTMVTTTMATATALALASSSVAASIFEASTPSSDTWMSVRTVGAIVGVLAIFILAVVALNCLGYRGLRRFFPGLLRQNAQGVLIAPIGLANIHPATGQPGPVPQPAPITVGTGGAVVAVRFPPAPPSPVKLSPR